MLVLKQFNWNLDIRYLELKIMNTHGKIAKSTNTGKLTPLLKYL